MKKLTIALLFFSALLSLSAHSEEKYSHFPAIESKDLTSAMFNIQAYNQKLNTILNKSELTTEDMVKVHELTYTLENAVNFLRASLEQTSIDLEKVHKASEVLNASIIKESGKEYMDSTSLFGTPAKCEQ